MYFWSNNSSTGYVDLCLSAARSRFEELSSDLRKNRLSNVDKIGKFQNPRAVGTLPKTSTRLNSFFFINNHVSPRNNKLKTDLNLSFLSKKLKKLKFYFFIKLCRFSFLVLQSLGRFELELAGKRASDELVGQLLEEVGGLLSQAEVEVEHEPRG